MFTYQITWLTNRGALITINAGANFEDYDTCWRCGVSFARANKVETGSLCILRDGKLLDEITINL